MKNKTKDSSEKVFKIYFINLNRFESEFVLKKNFPLFDFTYLDFDELSSLSANDISKSGFVIFYDVLALNKIIDFTVQFNVPFALIVNKSSEAVQGFKMNAIHCVEVP